jgi:hypothetical protein
MPDFSPIITQAYLRILGRRPDAGGLASWNRSMNEGLSEAAMREELLRSPEYAQHHPDAASRTKRPAAAKARSGGGTGRGRTRRRPRK